MNIISTHNFSKAGPVENRRRFMKVKDYLDFDKFRAEMRVSKMGIFSYKQNVIQFIICVLRV